MHAECFCTDIFTSSSSSDKRAEKEVMHVLLYITHTGVDQRKLQGCLVTQQETKMADRITQLQDALNQVNLFVISFIPAVIHNAGPI